MNIGNFVMFEIVAYFLASATMSANHYGKLSARKFLVTIQQNFLLTFPISSAHPEGRLTVCNCD
jgi:hypothetical protein